MDQELKRKTLVATAGGVIKAVQLDALAPAIVDLTYRTDDPFIIELTVTAFAETQRGSHAESSTWLIGRDLFAQGLTTGEPVGEGDVAIAYDRRHDQVSIAFTDTSERNPDGLAGTHRLVVDGEPIRTLVHHAYLLVPVPRMDVDAFIDDVLGAGS